MKEEMLIFVEQDIQRSECVKNQRGEFVENLKAIRTATLMCLLFISLCWLHTVRMASFQPNGWVIALLLSLFVFFTES